MSDFATWLAGLWSSIWTTFLYFLTDLPLMVLNGILGGIATLIEGIVTTGLGVPTLNSLIVTLPSGVQWFLVQLGVAHCLEVLAAGVAIRLVRKAVTLFQW